MFAMDQIMFTSYSSFQFINKESNRKYQDVYSIQIQCIFKKKRKREICELPRYRKTLMGKERLVYFNHFVRVNIYKKLFILECLFK